MFTYTFIGVFATFILTVLGSTLVFLFKKPISEKINTIFYSLSAGIMFAATIWSLIIPSLNHSEYLGAFKFVPCLIGIFIGAGFIVFLDFIISRVNKSKIGLSKNMKIFTAITIHNIPEGLAVGFAFGVAIVNNSLPLCMSALSLAIGIGIQNFPEGAAVSLPMKAQFCSRFKAFMFGVYSALVEPIACVVGILLANILSSIFSYILGFSAGAMLYVLIEELLPEANLNGKTKLGTWFFIIGFCFMMILDVVFG